MGVFICFDSVVVVSNIVYFHPELWGRFKIGHMTIIFFRWVGSTANHRSLGTHSQIVGGPLVDPAVAVFFFKNGAPCCPEKNWCASFFSENPVQDHSYFGPN